MCRKLGYTFADTGLLFDALTHTSFRNERPDVAAADMCLAVTGDDDAYALLDAGVRSGLFLIQLDEKESWFRYHHLFQELLQHKLKTQAGKGTYVYPLRKFMRSNAGTCMNQKPLVAKGEADLYPRFGRTMEWDTAAGHAILVAAGGTAATVALLPLIGCEWPAGEPTPAPTPTAAPSRACASSPPGTGRCS